jgi:SAM-dependent methyltransferase
MRNAALHVAGLAMGTANALRHRLQGYVNPRPFSSADVHRTIQHAIEVVDRLQTDGAIDWQGKRVLELGPGSDLSTGAVILRRGAASYRAIDRFDNRDQADPSLYAKLGEALNSPVLEQHLEFTLAKFPALTEVTGMYDLIVSNATLEHIEAIPEVFRSLRRLASPGARMVHHIDGQTHMRWIKDIDPLNILRYSKFTYDNLLMFPGAPNRLRADDYLAAARSAGWSSVKVRGDVTADPRYLADARFAKEYRRIERLRLLTFTLVAELAA